MARYVLLALLILAAACSNDPPEAAPPENSPVEPPTTTASPTHTAPPTEAPTVTRNCPAQRDRAGDEYEYDKSLMSASEAEKKHCGTRVPVSGSCPEPYANAGDEFSFDPDETDMAGAIKENCSAWQTFRGQTDGKFVVATEAVYEDSLPQQTDPWTLALWCADGNLYAVVTSSGWPINPFDGLGILPVAYRFGDWETLEDVETAIRDLSGYVNQKAEAEYEAEYEAGLEFQAIDEDDPIIRESPQGLTEEFWIVETDIQRLAAPGTERYRKEYRDFAYLWWSEWSKFIGMPAESADKFIDAIKAHQFVAFVDWSGGFAFNLTGAERDVEPVLQECGY